MPWGVGALTVGLGVAAYRWVVSADKLADEVVERELRESERQDRTQLTRLRRRVVRDKDPRTGDCVDKLVKLRKRMSQAARTNEDGESPVSRELADKAEELYRSCVTTLERSFELFQAAQGMATSEARDGLLRSRDALVGEVVQGVDHLGATVDYLQSASLASGADETNLGRIREELETGLEVARRVSERVSRLEQDLAERER
jgi:hypothetical protein